MTTTTPKLFGLVLGSIFKGSPASSAPQHTFPRISSCKPFFGSSPWDVHFLPYLNRGGLWLSCSLNQVVDKPLLVAKGSLKSKRAHLLLSPLPGAKYAAYENTAPMLLSAMGIDRPGRSAARSLHASRMFFDSLPRVVAQRLATARTRGGNIKCKLSDEILQRKQRVLGIAPHSSTARPDRLFVFMPTLSIPNICTAPLNFTTFLPLYMPNAWMVLASQLRQTRCCRRLRHPNLPGRAMLHAAACGRLIVIAHSSSAASAALVNGDVPLAGMRVSLPCPRY